MDVKISFLNGDLDDKVYMMHSKGLQGLEKKHLVCWLANSLYGIKQDPQAWYLKLYQYLTDSRFRKKYSQPTLYLKNSGDDIVILNVYVDDLAIT